MSSPSPGRRLLAELKRRKVFRVAGVYAATAFVVWQASSFVLPALGFPEWSVDLVVVLSLLGFPVALVLAWAYEVTPDGVRRTETTEPGPASPSASDQLTDGTGEDDDRDNRRAVLVGVGAGILLAAAGLGITSWYLDSEPPAPGPDATSASVEGAMSVAVLPFRVSGSGLETWREGMVTVLSTGLDGAAGIRAIDEQTVLSRWQRSRDAREGEGESLDLAVARELGATYALIGSAVSLGADTRFVVEVHRADTGAPLGQAQVQGHPDSIMSLADELTRQVLRILLERSGEAPPSVNLASLTTASIPALKAYLAGEQHYRRGEFAAAIERYREAVRADSTFALAHWRLAWAYAWENDWGERATSSLMRAAEFADRLPERERRLVRADYLYNVRQHVFAVRDTLRRLTEAYPDEPQAWYLLGELLFHSGLPDRFRGAERAFARAVELDSGFAPFHNHLFDLAIVFHHDSVLAEERLAKHPGLAADSLVPRSAISLAFGTPQRREATYAVLDSLDDDQLESVRRMLEHPHAWRALEAVLREFRSRGDPELARRAAQVLLEGSLHQGLYREAADYLEQHELTEENRICAVAPALAAGLPVPGSLVAEDVEPPGPQTAFPTTLCRGLVAVERGDTALLEAVRSRLRRSSGDTPVAAALELLDALEARRSGDPERALRLVGENRVVVRADLELWLGDLHREVGRLEDAEGWYLGAWKWPIAHERLGQVYEELGRPAEARAAYGRFVAAWEDADQKLQPRVEAARRRIETHVGLADSLFSAPPVADP